MNARSEVPIRLRARWLSLWLACTVLAPRPAFAWGNLGHRVIAEFARRRFSADTRQHVVAVMGTDDLAATSNWADDVRGAAHREPPLATDPEAVAFNARFPQSQHWHYVDLPLSATAYPDGSPFTSPDDIVHAIERCIRALETPSARAEMTHSQALRLLVHLVGDLHQPLHLAEGYYRVGDAGSPVLVMDPAVPSGLLEDHGGNSLHFGDERLHPFWDVTLVDRLSPSRDVQQLVSSLRAVPRPSDTAGPVSTWARQWVATVLPFAREAYAGLIFESSHLDARFGTQWNVRLPSGYEAHALEIVRTLLADAGYRLADMLARLSWAA